MNWSTAGELSDIYREQPFPAAAGCSGGFDKAGEVPFGLDALSDAKILGPFCQQEIDHLLGLLLIHDSRDWGHPLLLSLPSIRHFGWLEGRGTLRVFKHKESSISFGSVREPWEPFLEIRNPR